MNAQQIRSSLLHRPVCYLGCFNMCLPKWHLGHANSRHCTSAAWNMPLRSFRLFVLGSRASLHSSWKTNTGIQREEGGVKGNFKFLSNMEPEWGRGLGGHACLFFVFSPRISTLASVVSQGICSSHPLPLRERKGRLSYSLAQSRPFDLLVFQF